MIMRVICGVNADSFQLIKVILKIKFITHRDNSIVSMAMTENGADNLKFQITIK